MRTVAELQMPVRPPDINEQLRTSSTSVWLPAPEQSGLLMTAGPEYMAFSSPRPYMDMAYIAPVLEKPTTLQPLYAYLGVHYEQSREEHGTVRKASFSHVETVNERLAALDVPGDHKPPQLTAWEGDDFPAQAGLDELIATGNFLAAVRGEYAPHDMLVHFALAQVLMRPQDIDQLAIQATRARQEGAQEVADFMDKIDICLSSVGLGRRVAEAFAYEHQLKQAAAEGQTIELKPKVEASWRSVGDMYAMLVAPLEDYARPEELREHCLVLSSAARRQLAE